MQCNVIISESLENIINELLIILLEEKGFLNYFGNRGKNIFPVYNT